MAEIWLSLVVSAHYREIMVNSKVIFVHIVFAYVTVLVTLSTVTSLMP